MRERERGNLRVLGKMKTGVRKFHASKEFLAINKYATLRPLHEISSNN